MNFKELLSRAKDDDLQAKEAIIDGVFDEDLYQELRIVLLHCIQAFPI